MAIDTEDPPFPIPHPLRGRGAPLTLQNGITPPRISTKAINGKGTLLAVELGRNLTNRPLGRVRRRSARTARASGTAKTRRLSRRVALKATQRAGNRLVLSGSSSSSRRTSSRRRRLASDRRRLWSCLTRRSNNRRGLGNHRCRRGLLGGRLRSRGRLSDMRRLLRLGKGRHRRHFLLGAALRLMSTLLLKELLGICRLAEAASRDTLVNERGPLALGKHKLLLGLLLLKKSREDAVVMLKEVDKEETWRAVLDRELGLVLRAEEASANGEREFCRVRLVVVLLRLGAGDKAAELAGLSGSQLVL